MHPRRIIRAKAVELLKGSDGDHPTAAEDRVHPARTVPLFPAGMPAILVYTGSETIDRDVALNVPGARRRLLELTVEIYAAKVPAEGGQATPEPEDTIDDVAASVEAVLDASETLDLLVESCTLRDTAIDGASDGEIDVFAASMIYDVVYYTVPDMDDPAAPPTIVKVGFEPDTGPGQEDSYHEVTG